MTSRRRFLAAGGAAALVARGAGAAKSEFNYSEVEARIAKRDFHGLTKEDLGTPALILDGSSGSSFSLSSVRSSLLASPCRGTSPPALIFTAAFLRWWPSSPYFSTSFFRLTWRTWGRWSVSAWW